MLLLRAKFDAFPESKKLNSHICLQSLLTLFPFCAASFSTLYCSLPSCSRSPSAWLKLWMENTSRTSAKHLTDEIASPFLQ